MVIAALTIQTLGLPFSAAGTPTGDDTTQAVTYTLSDGFDLRALVVLKPDGTFEFSWDGCKGPIARASGTYASDSREVSLRRIPPVLKETRAHSRTAWFVFHALPTG